MAGWAAERLKGGLRDFASTLEAETGVSLGKAYGRARLAGRATVKAARWAAPRVREYSQAAARAARERATVIARYVEERLDTWRRGG